MESPCRFIHYLEVFFEEPPGVAVEDGLHLVLGEALAAECVGQQRELGAVVHFQLAADAVEVTAQTDDLNAAHLLEVGRVLCHQGRGTAAELFFGLVVEEAAAVVQTHEAALVGESADHLVGEVAAVGCEGAAVGVAGRKGAGGVLHNVPEAPVGQVAQENATNANCDILNKLYTYCKEKNPQFYMVSEVWASENVIADYYASGTPSMFNFDAGTAKGALVNAVRKGDPVSLVNSMLKYQNDFSAKNPDYIDAPFLSNHDMARIANTLVNDPDKIKTAAGLLMTMNGSPFVYYGEEIGMNSSGTKDENKRIPMVWSKTDTTGMTKGPADMDAGIESPFPAEDEQEKDKDSILSYYKNALRLRNQNPEIARGTIEKVESLCKDSQAAITKTYQDSTIGIVYNLGEGNDTVDLKGTALENMNLEGSLTLKEETVQLKDGKLEMPACSIAVLK